jgi:hypothetical protein
MNEPQHPTYQYAIEYSGKHQLKLEFNMPNENHFKNRSEFLTSVHKNIARYYIRQHPIGQYHGFTEISIDSNTVRIKVSIHVPLIFRNAKLNCKSISFNDPL